MTVSMIMPARDLAPILERSLSPRGGSPSTNARIH